MKVVKVRSPFTIEIDEAGQAGSKLELFMWQYGSSAPATPNYTLSKQAASLTQKINFYNVSNYVKEYIDNIKPTFPDSFGGLEQNNEWIFFKVKRYWLDGPDYVLLDEKDYVGVNGFTNYLDGRQNPSDSVIDILGNTNLNNYYYKQDTYPTNTIQYFNVLIDKPTTTTTTIAIKYERIDGTVYSFTANFAVGFAGIYNYQMPLTVVKANSNFINGCKVTVTYTPETGDPIINSFYTYPIEECKYTPMLCSFINRFGGWDYLNFFKAKVESYEVKNKEYQLLPDSVDYSIYRGQSQAFNFDAKNTLKINTGWLDESYNVVIKDLMASETILLDNVPVKLKTMTTELKTSLQDKMINYQIEFEYNYNQINNVI